jgi:hypothetical protein
MSYLRRRPEIPCDGIDKVREIQAEIDLAISFRKWLEASDDEEIEARINALLDSDEFVFFLEKDGEVYAAPESSRVVFANLKNSGNGDMPKGWKDEATFMVLNLNRALAGGPPQAVFDKKDVNKIHILSREEAVAKLKKMVPSKTVVQMQIVKKTDK